MKAHIFVLVVSVLLTGFGAWASVAEFRPYAETRNQPAKRFAAAEQGVPAYGWSHDSQFLALRDCALNISSNFGKAQPTPRRNQVLENCALLSERIIAHSPANGFAWYVRASVAAQHGNMIVLNTALARSQKLNPNEQWLAEMRVHIFEDAYAGLSAEAREAELSDLSILVLSNRGIRAIANRYVNEPSFRERITLVVEKLPPEAQAKFVRAVRTVNWNI